MNESLKLEIIAIGVNEIESPLFNDVACWF